jgi:hypothetical protein
MRPCDRLPLVHPDPTETTETIVKETVTGWVYAPTRKIVKEGVTWWVYAPTRALVSGKPVETVRSHQGRPSKPKPAEQRALYKVFVDDTRQAEGRMPTIKEALKWGEPHGIPRDDIRELRKPFANRDSNKGGRPKKI